MLHRPILVCSLALALGCGDYPVFWNCECQKAATDVHSGEDFEGEDIWRECSSADDLYELVDEATATCTADLEASGFEVATCECACAQTSERCDK